MTETPRASAFCDHAIRGRDVLEIPDARGDERFAANPLVIFHLVSGVHNEAMMIGLMLVGLELCLAALARNGPLRGHTLTLFLAGVTLIGLSAALSFW